MSAILLRERPNSKEDRRVSDAAAFAIMQRLRGDHEHEKIDPLELATQFGKLSQLLPETPAGTTRVSGFTPDKRAIYVVAFDAKGALERVTAITASPNSPDLQIKQDVHTMAGVPYVTTVEGRLSSQQDPKTGETVYNIAPEDETFWSQNNPDRQVMATPKLLAGIGADLPHLQTRNFAQLHQHEHPNALPPA